MNIVKREVLRWHGKDNLTLTDASENSMKVEGIINLFVKPELVNGKPNRNGRLK